MEVLRRKGITVVSDWLEVIFLPYTEELKLFHWHLLRRTFAPI